MLQVLHTSPSRWIALGIGAGVISGLSAVAFFVALEWATHWTLGVLVGMPPLDPPGDRLLSPPGAVASEPRRWLFFLLPAIGGLLAGLVVHRFAPEAGGAGIDEMIRAFHSGRGVIRRRVPWVKSLATIFTLASGGSGGKEGPVAQIGAGLGSTLAGWLKLNARDRRILLLAGAAGGLGAIFRAPLGSALTAIEVLYKEDFESDALIPCVISSVTAYVLFVTMLGGPRIFDVPQFDVPTPIEVPGYLLLALVGVPAGMVYIWFFDRTRRFFARLGFHPAAKPMIGGFGVGLIGLWVPQVYGNSWGWVQRAIDDVHGRADPAVVLPTLAVLAVAKIVATSITIGSGGSGGLFVPTLFIGGMIGGVVGYGGHLLAPLLFPDPAAYVLVGMASFFAGVASAPIGAMLMVAEMTGGYTLLPPLMLVSVVAIVMVRHRSIYVHQLKDRFQSPAHAADLTVNVLEEMSVRDLFRATPDVPHVDPSTGFMAFRDLILGSHDATVPVVASDGRLVGLLTAEQIRPVMDERQLDSFVVAGDICAPPVAVHVDDDLYRAHELFRSSGCPQIPVVDDPDDGSPPKIIGMLDYRDLMRAYERELDRRRES
jgi:CIC family chloride channel protein